MPIPPISVSDRRGPFCGVTGCVNLSEGGVYRRFPKDWSRELCAEHLQPVHAELNRQLQRGRMEALHERARA